MKTLFLLFAGALAALSGVGKTSTPAFEPSTVSGITVSAISPEQGETLVISIPSASSTPQSAFLGDERIDFFPFRDSLLSIVGIDVKAKPGVRNLAITLPSGQIVQRDIMIRTHVFPETRFVVPSPLAMRGVSAGTLTQKIVAQDKPAFDSVFAPFTPHIYFTDAFIPPLKRWIDVGGFGVVRVGRDGAIRHLGVDLSAPVGEIVHAINSGEVRLVRTLPDAGLTVVIDHGMGMYSAYLHLSKAKVQEGQEVSKGDEIGRTGASGDYVLAPHLHFSVKINGASVNPKKFIDMTDQFLVQ